LNQSDIHPDPSKNPAPAGFFNSIMVAVIKIFECTSDALLITVDRDRQINESYAHPSVLCELKKK
jgi:hypothetical protein